MTKNNQDKFNKMKETIISLLATLTVIIVGVIGTMIYLAIIKHIYPCLFK